MLRIAATPAADHLLHAGPTESSFGVADLFVPRGTPMTHVAFAVTAIFKTPYGCYSFGCFVGDYPRVAANDPR